MKIEDLKKGQTSFNIHAEISEVMETREVKTIKGLRKVRNFVIKDGTGEASFGIWGKFIDQVKDLETGCSVEINGGEVKKDYNGRKQLWISFENLHFEPLA